MGVKRVSKNESLRPKKRRKISAQTFPYTGLDDKLYKKWRKMCQTDLCRLSSCVDLESWIMEKPDTREPIVYDWFQQLEQSIKDLNSYKLRQFRKSMSYFLYDSY